MASASDSRVEERPPALPVKQRRFSSVDSDSIILSPTRLQHQNYACSDVFQDYADCHAAQCPIHHHHDLSKQQVRAFSDTTPPPVPKKLSRSLSHPVTNMSAPSPPSPLSPRQRHSQNFDNPLYMMTRIPDAFFQEAEDIRTTRGSPVPLPSLSQLSFDTPDDHLPSVFSDFEDQQVVSQEIQHHLLLLLRGMAQSVEVRSLLQGEATERGMTSYQPQDFLVCERSKPKQIGDSVYYSVCSPDFPKRVLGLKVHEQMGDPPAARAKHRPSHVNVQDLIAYFQPSDILKKHNATLQFPTESCCSSRSDCSDSDPPAGSSTEVAADSSSAHVCTVESLLQRGGSASVERDLPDATLDDFVQEAVSLPSTECSDYARQVCVLLLQILMGAHHLHSNDAAAVLRPREIFLVWPKWKRDVVENEMRLGVSDGLRGLKNSRREEEMEWAKTERTGKIQALWKTRGSPRVVLVPQASAPSFAPPLTSIKSQIGDLIQFCLQPQENSTSLGSVPTLFKCSYRRGLVLLSAQLQSENAPQITHVVAMLQALLWGPRGPLFGRGCASTTAVHNWFTIKRALLLMKLAERGLNLHRSALDWEDCMCLQYLSFTGPETVVSAVTQLWKTEQELRLTSNFNILFN
ncbi:inactive tyrosine-protein kinase PRAG1 [Xenentodon cancila]